MKTTDELIFEKSYCGETVHDIEEMLLDAISQAKIPVDEYGFYKGEFVVRVEWKPD